MTQALRSAPPGSKSRVRLAARALVVGAAIALVVGSISPAGSAQDQNALVRALHSRSFRVRVQAAFALGKSGNPRARSHLERALRDRQQAVRAAAAVALGNLGAAEAIPALERARRDSDSAVRMQVERSLRRLRAIAAKHRTRRGRQPGDRGVYPSIRLTAPAGRIPWHHVRYAVYLGDMRDASGYRGDDLADHLRTELQRQLELFRGIAVFPHGEADAAAERQMKNRHVSRMRLEGNVTTLERRARRGELAIRCEVSLMLLDEPGRNMRGVLKGAATGKGRPRRTNRKKQERDLAVQALSGAVRSAMANVPTALALARR